MPHSPVVLISRAALYAALLWVSTALLLVLLTATAWSSQRTIVLFVWTDVALVAALAYTIKALMTAVARDMLDDMALLLDEKLRQNPTAVIKRLNSAG